MDTNKKKAWVVHLSKKSHANGKKEINVDVKYVRARTREGAVRTAKLNSFMKGVRNASCSARLADPVKDLGCVKSPSKNEKSSRAQTSS